MAKFFALAVGVGLSVLTWAAHQRRGLQEPAVEPYTSTRRSRAQGLAYRPRFIHGGGSTWLVWREKGPVREGGDPYGRDKPGRPAFCLRRTFGGAPVSWGDVEMLGTLGEGAAAYFDMLEMSGGQEWLIVYAQWYSEVGSIAWVWLRTPLSGRSAESFRIDGGVRDVKNWRRDKSLTGEVRGGNLHTYGQFRLYRGTRPGEFGVFGSAEYWNPVVWRSLSQDGGRTWTAPLVIANGSSPSWVCSKEGNKLLFLVGIGVRLIGQSSAKIDDGTKHRETFSLPHTPGYLCVLRGANEVQECTQTLKSLTTRMYEACVRMDENEVLWLVYNRDNGEYRGRGALPFTSWDGEFVHHTQIEIRRSKDLGETWSRPIAVTSGEHYDFDPQITRVGETLVVAWYRLTPRSSEVLTTQVPVGDFEGLDEWEP